MRPPSAWLAVGLAVAFIGCATTQHAEKALNSRFEGQPVDAFFARYGAPQSSFALGNGGTVYRWRGGEGSITPPPPSFPGVAPIAGGGGSSSHTSSQTFSPQPGTTVTESTTTTVSGGVSISPQMIMPLLMPPPKPIPVYCELNIATDARGIITGIHAAQDTQSQGPGVSRCAEYFDVK